MQINLFIILLILAFLISIVITVYVGMRRTSRVKSELFLAMLSISIWSFAAIFEAAFTGLDLKILFSKITYLGIATLPVLFFFFISSYTNMDHWLTKRNKLFLFLVPAATFVLAATNELHGLLWPNIYLKQNKIAGIFAFYEHGTWYWVNILYSYSFLIAGLVMLIFSLFRHKRFYSLQTRVLLIASLSPIIGNAVYSFYQSSIGGMEITPVCFTLTGLFLTLAIFKYRFLDITPIAREVIIENLYDGVLLVDKNNKIIDINGAACRLLSLDNSDIGKSVDIALSDNSEILEHLKMEKNLKKTVKEVGIRDNKLFLELRITHIVDNEKKRTGIIIILRDITGEKSAERKLKESQNMLLNIIDFLPDATFAIDKESKVIAWNKAIEDLTGIKKEDILGKGDYEYAIPFHGERRPILIDYIVGDLPEPEKQYNVIEKKGNNLVVELEVTLNGKNVHLWIEASPLLDGNNKIIGAIESLRNITDIKNVEKELRYISFHDNLTGLYNRAYFEEELKRLNRSRQLPLSIIVADINGMKLVNDAFGHNIGDRLLKHATRIIKKSCRADDILARWGGDEFIILLPATRTKEAQEVIDRILFNCERARFKIPISISMGSATKINPRTRISTVLKKAEDTMYGNKLLSSKSVQNSIVRSLTKILFKRNIKTEAHSERVISLSKKLAEKIGLPEDKMGGLILHARLYDIGKVAINERILKKRSRLKKSERDEIKKHFEIGYRIANSSSVLAPIAEFILCQHEWWDGSGHPRGLKGNKIPIISRIVALTDAYNAMISDRPYRKAYSRKRIIRELEKSSGTQFDPNLVSVFLELLNEDGL